MNVIIPVAGEGVRLKPHTNILPKCLLYVAGNTILGHILDSLKPLKVKKTVIVLGSKTHEIVNFCNRYSRAFSFITQSERLGLGHAIYTGAKGLKGPTLVVLGDTIVEHDLKTFTRSRSNVLAVKKVQNPQRFGIIEIANDKVIDVVEKPQYPKSNLAIIGLYFFQRIENLYRALNNIIKRGIKTKGEYQLTDGLRLLIKQGEGFKTAIVDKWFDCGTPEALIETNRHLLKKTHYYKKREGTIVKGSVYIHDSTLITNSLIGPDVSIAENAIIRDSIIMNSIVNKGAVVEKSMLAGSIIGQNSLVRCNFKRINVGDHSVIELP